MTIRPIRFILLVFSLILLIASCKKLNESSELGDNVLPGVDGVHTFDTTLTVQTYDSIAHWMNDSIRVEAEENHILGNISMDPIFGKTNATMFFQLRPETFKWAFSDIYKKDSLYIDSVVMVLGWNATYGDTTARQRVRVYEMDPVQPVDFVADTFSKRYMLQYKYFTYSNLLGTKEFFPYELNDSVKAYKDTTAGQLRVRLNNAFGRRLLDYDTSGAYKNDSTFKTYLKGFAVEADQSMGNALMAFTLANNPNTKLAIYYRYTSGGQDDTTVSYFKFYPTSSAQHNFIDRFGFAGTPLLAQANDNVQDNIDYLINTPGSFTTVKIPGIRTFQNAVINRAELIVQQVYDPSDNIFTVPPGMMLDVFDSSLMDYKYVPYDYVVTDQGVPTTSFGLYGKNAFDGAGKTITVWKFNITRYLQNILLQKEPLHNFRLHTPYAVKLQRLRQNFSANTGDYGTYSTYLNPYMSFGRVRVGGGNHPTQPMKLRIIYTKI